MREKIAILGGGIGSLTAAYELAVQDRYDITVYQMGWRLGGQGASGRNRALGDRIEEMTTCKPATRDTAPKEGRCDGFRVSEVSRV
jgi:uncharacterized protein with NAD-binding domain and iron-sulfur cluster